MGRNGVGQGVHAHFEIEVENSPRAFGKHLTGGVSSRQMAVQKFVNERVALFVRRQKIEVAGHSDHSAASGSDGRDLGVETGRGHRFRQNESPIAQRQ